MGGRQLEGQSPLVGIRELTSASVGSGGSKLDREGLICLVTPLLSVAPLDISAPSKDHPVYTLKNCCCDHDWDS